MHHHHFDMSTGMHGGVKNKLCGVNRKSRTRKFHKVDKRLWVTDSSLLDREPILNPCNQVFWILAILGQSRILIVWGLQSLTWIAGLAVESNPIHDPCHRDSMWAIKPQRLQSGRNKSPSWTNTATRLVQPNVLKMGHCGGTDNVHSCTVIEYSYIHYTIIQLYRYTIYSAALYAFIDIVAVDAVLVAKQSWQSLQVKENQM